STRSRVVASTSFAVSLTRTSPPTGYAELLNIVVVQFARCKQGRPNLRGGDHTSRDHAAGSTPANAPGQTRQRPRANPPTPPGEPGQTRQRPQANPGKRAIAPSARAIAPSARAIAPQQARRSARAPGAARLARVSTSCVELDRVNLSFG